MIHIREADMLNYAWLRPRYICNCQVRTSRASVRRMTIDAHVTH